MLRKGAEQSLMNSHNTVVFLFPDIEKNGGGHVFSSVDADLSENKRKRFFFFLNLKTQQ